MDRDRYLSLLNGDAALLRATAVRDLDADVSTCPGWKVRDAVEHVCEVYEHKVAAIAAGGAKPDPWPPPDWPADRDPIAWFDVAYARLRDALVHTDPGAPSWTWWPEDQTAGFWLRRMAQETAMHRADVECAHGLPSPIADDLALDGIDELFFLMFAGDWSDLPQPELTGTFTVSAADRSWRVGCAPEEVTVAKGGGDADGTVTGNPSDVLLWLYGRVPDPFVELGGDPDALVRFRERLTLATQ
ncbi:MAG TPA: maleylpyruvate isomerase family mycothiol-dependent enzyme [Frankiaceae bacterium]|nr:maleylpyruvate isomerase family mycothiol-dependent enzyme [Frankiaceae bacterium]